MNIRTSHPPRLLFTLIALLLSMPVLLPPAARAAEPLKQKLSVSFDTGAHRLRGTSTIELAAGRELLLRVDGLDVSDLEVDGGSAEIVSKEGLVAIPAATRSRTVRLSFGAVFAGEGHGMGSLVDDRGIVLLDLWYPVPVGESIMSLTARIPAEFSAVTEADEISYGRSQGGMKTVTTSFSRPLSFFHFIAGPYEVSEETLADGTVLATYFFPEDAKYAGIYGDKTRGYLERYTELVGPYPYRRYSVVENRLPTGLAMPTFTLLGQAVVHLPFITETSLGHEVLHSWFGNAVKVDYGEGNWCEGLTTYLADQAYVADKGEGMEFRKAQLVKYQSYVDADNEMTVTDFRDAGDHDLTSRKTRAVGYNKVSMIFHMLKNKVGEQDFVAALRDFYRTKRYVRAGWSDLRASFERVTGSDLEPFFNQWLTRADVIELDIRNVDMVMEKGEQGLSFELIQKTRAPYTVNVPVLIKNETTTVEETIAISGKSEQVHIPFPGFATELILDPDYDLMRRLSSYELPPVWSRFEGAAEKLAVLEKDAGEKFAALLPLLEKMECPILTDEEAAAENLAGKSLLFLGSDSTVYKSLFGGKAGTSGGFTLRVRENPLDPSQVAVLVTATGADQVEAVAHKLRHYGKYGFLSFEDGTIKQKEIPETDQGQAYLIDVPPRGMAVQKSEQFDTIMDRMADSRVVYVGETHVDQTDHRLQLRVIQAMYERHPELAIGMEMFNRKAQEVLDAYIAGEIDERRFLKKSDYFANWGYDYRLYRDILRFARSKGLPVIALNLDKDIVSDTFKKGGIAGLDEEIRATLPPERDLAMPNYRERLGQVFKGHSGPHFNEKKLADFVQAQVLWDETMAETIADYLAGHPETRMVVLAGSGHVVKENAIPPRVARRIEVKQSVAVNVREDDLSPANADYVFFSAPVRAPLSPKLGVMLAEKDSGLTIAGFSSPHSVAKRGELAKDDIILELDGEQVDSVEDVKIALLYKERGDTITVKVRRPVFLLPDAVLDFEVRL